MIRYLTPTRRGVSTRPQDSKYGDEFAGRQAAVMAVQPVFDQSRFTPPDEMAGMRQDEHVAQALAQLRRNWLRTKQAFGDRRVDWHDFGDVCQFVLEQLQNFSAAVWRHVQEQVARRSVRPD